MSRTLSRINIKFVLMPSLVFAVPFFVERRKTPSATDHGSMENAPISDLFREIEEEAKRMLE